MPRIVRSRAAALLALGFDIVGAISGNGDGGGKAEVRRSGITITSALWRSLGIKGGVFYKPAVGRGNLVEGEQKTRVCLRNGLDS